MKRVVQTLFILLAVMIIGSVLLAVGGLLAVVSPSEERLTGNSILAIELEGVITPKNDEALEMLRKYRKESRIKGVLIRINSPGGVVGPSQELYTEIKRTREEFKKPVVAFCSSVAASGAYYAAVGANKIVTTPGCMIGSIGALMEFVNLGRLYDWAKVERYAITTGKFKDAGAEYKPLTTEQRQLFQALLDDVLDQFRGAVADGRNLKMEQVVPYADGRVFTGAQAVKLGFADSMGSWDDARKEIGELAGLGATPEMFKPKKHQGFMDFLEEASGGESRFKALASELLQTELNAQPLFILPGAIGR
jgi:protease-4